MGSYGFNVVAALLLLVGCGDVVPKTEKTDAGQSAPDVAEGGPPLDTRAEVEAGGVVDAGAEEVGEVGGGADAHSEVEAGVKACAPAPNKVWAACAENKNCVPCNLGDVVVAGCTVGGKLCVGDCTTCKGL